MTTFPKNVRLLWVTLIAGFTGATARAVLYRIGFDGKELLPISHPLQIFCWILLIGTAVYLASAVGKLDGSGEYGQNFPSNPIRFACCFAAFTFLTIHAFSLWKKPVEILDTLRLLLSFLCAGCMMVSLFYTIHGKRPHFLFQGLVCVYFATEMICRYRSWSGNPQLADYIFHLPALIFMALSAYHRTAFDVGLGRRRIHIFCSLMALCLGITCMVGPEPYEFYLGGALWCAGSMCTLDPPEKKQQEEA